MRWPSGTLLDLFFWMPWLAVCERDSSAESEPSSTQCAARTWMIEALPSLSGPALRVDGLFQRRGIGGLPGRQHDHEALLGKLLRDGAADTPADTDGQVTVVDHSAVCQLRIATIGLPFGGRPYHDGDRLTG